MFNLKKVKKLIMLSFAFILTLFAITINASAETASANGPMSSAYTSNKSLIYKTAQIKSKSGIELFCFNSALTLPNGNNYTREEVTSNQGVWNLLRYGKSIKANYAEKSVALHTYLAEQKGNSSYKVHGGPTIKTSYAKQNTKVKKMVDYGKKHNKLEKVKINKTNVKAVWSASKKMNIVKNIKASGFSGKYKLTGVPSGVTFYKKGNNKKVNINSIAVDTILELRAKPNVDIKNAKITIKPLTATKEIGLFYTATNSKYQQLIAPYRVDPLEPVMFTLNSSDSTSLIKGLKYLDDLDLYDQEVIIDGNPYYKTKDGLPVMFKTELGELSLASPLRYPTKDECITNDCYNKPFTYEYLDYNHLKEEKQKLDENSKPILITDANGIEPGQPGYVDTYEMESVNVIDAKTGYPIVIAKKDSAANYVYGNTTTSFNISDEDKMNNYYKAQLEHGIEFTLYKSDKKTIIKKVIADKGAFEFAGLLPDTYYVRETKTKDGFNLDSTWHKIVLGANKTVTVNSNKVIVNQINYSELYISKVDATGEIEIDGANMELLDEDGNIIDEWVSKAGEPHYVKVKPGKYHIKETSAPEGYELLTVMIPVEVLETGEVIHTNVKNEIIKADMKLKKVDITSEKELEGAKLCVISPDGNKINIFVDGKDRTEKQYCWISTKKQKEFTLYAGKYALKETIAPKGYLKKEQVIPFEVNESGVKEIKVKNEPIKYTRTGGIKVNPLVDLNKMYRGLNSSVSALD